MTEQKTYLNTLEIKNLYKKYSKKADWAVSDISFTCKSGEIIGVLGANGAGKSTTLKCVTGMIPFEKGDITICGYSVKANPIKAKRHFSFVTDAHIVFEKMTGVQYLTFMADIYGVSTEDRNTAYEKLEKIFNLGNKVEDLISSYSHGMKQKICMMGSLIHSPSLWILDEPFLGLDPFVQQSLIEYMQEYVKDGKTIIFSSHNLDAVKKLCQRVIFISHGKLTNDLVITDEIKQSTTILENYYTNTILDKEQSENS